MVIVGTLPVRALRAQESRKGAAQPVQDSFVPSSGASSTATELWRDFGINPAAMARRAFLEKPLAGGASLPGGVKAPAPLMKALQDDLVRVIEGSDGLATLQTGLQDVAKSVGIELSIESGAPLVNWDSVRPEVLDVRHPGGPAALHEMVHVVQCVIGGAAALGHAAAEKFRSANGRDAVSVDELRPFLKGLDESEKRNAMQRVVKPMESLAYSRFEETAFHTAGMSGRKGHDYAGYQSRLKSVAEAFVGGYTTATVPELETKWDAKLYGGVAHVGRTHGETALLLAGGGAAYYGLTRLAMGVHPALAIPMAAPLGYVLYRALVSG